MRGDAAARRQRVTSRRGETGQYARTKSFKAEAELLEWQGGIVRGAGESGISALATAFDLGSVAVKEEAQARYDRAQDLIDDYYSRGVTGNLLERASQKVAKEFIGAGKRFHAAAERKLLEGAAGAMGKGSRLLTGVGVVLALQDGVNNQTADDADENIDTFTRIRRNTIRGVGNVAGGLGGAAVVGGLTFTACSQASPLVGIACGAGGAVVGGGVGQVFGDWYTKTYINDVPEIAMP